ncbi:hypothetical protein PTSG_07370 [Salpingoeca rosetta]|uniref:ubiquitinyl hydrolase 1 n=1 Tax=Salpingoeca rosetta (strain ATCC 50818 / BSB-021) TaxID=946362 RepID=F2UIH9_SALR5|nr:uncharacterized protein PTSG_07370 [Salpingoeca rosetta]EGD77028.1 hypothetical protein PTSG_07370 [Salpingoeca rosetta]|eukprot:XP_004990868.1 hypothetical protein PTSG_07370 [Salpingoeca rosetta]
MGWTLRIRYSGSVQQLHDVDETASLQALHDRIAAAVGVPAESMRLLAGFPPRPLASADDVATTEKPLTEIPGLSNCTTLVVTQPPQQQQQQEQQGDEHSSGGADAASRAIAARAAKASRARDGAGKGGGGPGRGRGRGGKPTASEEQADALSWQDGLADDLIKAVDGNAVTASLRDLRQSVKDMMLKAQAQRRAYDRETAARGGTHEIGDVPGEFTLSGISRRFRVTFPIGRRKTAHEDYPKLPAIIIGHLFTQLSRHPDHRENLRPFNMALTSPNVFWNVVRLKDETGEAAANMDLEEYVQSLAPGADWSFLRHRVRNMSAKALENKRMADERKRRREARQAKAKRAKAQADDGDDGDDGGDDGDEDDNDGGGEAVVGDEQETGTADDDAVVVVD